jgi:hypothetical protein
MFEIRRALAEGNEQVLDLFLGNNQPAAVEKVESLVRFEANKKLDGWGNVLCFVSMSFRQGMCNMQGGLSYR